MKIAYLYHRNAANAEVQSGRPASIRRQLLAMGAEVEDIFPLSARPSGSSLSRKILSRLTGHYHRGDRDASYLAALAGEAQARMAGRHFDVVFCPGSEVISALETAAPITFCADATFANLVNYYWDFSRISAAYLRKGHAQEASALKRASLAIYPSEWAARSAIDYYGMDPQRVKVIPFGANLGAENRREQVEQWIQERPGDRVRLVFVGRDWKRKGGDLVVAAVQSIVAQGVKVELDLVGCEVPGRLRGVPWIKTHGLLRASVPAERARFGALYAQAHFVFVPSRAEAYGMTFAEANAFGVPAIATATGGIPSVVRNGTNGFLLPPEAGPGDYARTILRGLGDLKSYRQFASRAFEEFETRLNWRVFCHRYVEAVASLGGSASGFNRARSNNNENRICL